MTNSTVNVLFSKAQNAPKRKTPTIPKLELFSVLIGVISFLFVTKAIKITVTEKILWTGYKDMLQWIKGGRNQVVLVRIRIKEITEKRNINFRYINTKYNPTDLPTRGISSKELKDSQHLVVWSVFTI